MKSDLRKFRLDQTGIDRGNTERRIDEIEPKPFGNRIDCKLGRAINIALWINFMPGYRAYIYYVPPTSLYHSGHDFSCHIKQSLHIRIYHLVPIVKRSILQFIESARKAGVIDEDVDCFPCFWQRIYGAIDSLTISNIELENVRWHFE